MYAYGLRVIRFCMLTWNLTNSCLTDELWNLFWILALPIIYFSLVVFINIILYWTLLYMVSLLKQCMFQKWGLSFIKAHIRGRGASLFFSWPAVTHGPVGCPRWGGGYALVSYTEALPKQGSVFLKTSTEPMATWRAKIFHGMDVFNPAFAFPHLRGDLGLLSRVVKNLVQI